MQLRSNTHGVSDLNIIIFFILHNYTIPKVSPPLDRPITVRKDTVREGGSCLFTSQCRALSFEALGGRNYNGKTTRASSESVTGRSHPPSARLWSAARRSGWDTGRLFPVPLVEREHSQLTSPLWGPSALTLGSKRHTPLEFNCSAETLIYSTLESKTQKMDDATH